MASLKSHILEDSAGLRDSSNDMTRMTDPYHIPEWSGRKDGGNQDGEQVSLSNANTRSD
jgi:hypothetical protein